MNISSTVSMSMWSKRTTSGHLVEQSIIVSSSVVEPELELPGATLFGWSRSCEKKAQLRLQLKVQL